MLYSWSAEVSTPPQNWGRWIQSCCAPQGWKSPSLYRSLGQVTLRADGWSLRFRMKSGCCSNHSFKDWYDSKIIFTFTAGSVWCSWRSYERLNTLFLLGALAIEWWICGGWSINSISSGRLSRSSCCLRSVPRLSCFANCHTTSFLFEFQYILLISLCACLPLNQLLVNTPI